MTKINRILVPVVAATMLLGTAGAAFAQTGDLKSQVLAGENVEVKENGEQAEATEAPEQAEAAEAAEPAEAAEQGDKDKAGDKDKD